MQGREKLEQINQWFASSEAAALIGAYQNHHAQGTTGILAHEKEKPAVINERGVLRPERFSEYMMALETRVNRALQTNEAMRPASDFDRTLPLLQSTLEQMIGSVDLPQGEYASSGKTLAQLFDTGKTMGRSLREYFDITQEHTGHASRNQRPGRW